MSIKLLYKLILLLFFKKIKVFDIFFIQFIKKRHK